ncbi:MAG: B12-binding domain-containing radical SAM protein [Thermodesulfobacteriota bacterium]
MKKIAVIFPSYYAFQHGRNPSGDWGLNWLQHGLASLVSYMRQRHKVSLIDMRKMRDWDEYIHVMKTHQYDYALFGCTTPDYNTATTAMRLLRLHTPQTKIIVGGTHATYLPQDFMKHDYIDHVVTGEGEIAMAKIIDGEIKQKLVFGNKWKIDLNDIPYIDRQDWDVERPGALRMKLPFITLITARECVYDCSFCAARSFFGGKDPRERKVDHVIGEIKQCIQDMDLGSFHINDDNFLQNNFWARTFADKLEALNHPMEFSFQGRADLIYFNRNKLMPRLKDVGAKWVFVGFESGSDKVLKLYNKRSNAEMNYKAVDVLREHGYKIFANIMFGAPGETAEDMQQTVDLVKYMKPEIMSPAHYTPYHGTPLRKYCEENNLIIEDLDHEQYVRGAGSGAKIKGVDYTAVEGFVQLAKFYERRVY